MAAGADPFADPFADHFSGHAAEYATFRPSYPAALIDHLAALAPARALAWDCATGSGQAALLLADRFARVVATDASREQIAHATPHPRVEYRVAREDDSGLAAGTADLVTVAQALHWFDLPRFWGEVARVLKPGGVIAAWCYARVRVEPAVDAIVGRFYSQRIGPFWPPERRLVEEEYRDIAFPFTELSSPKFAITASLTRREFLGYVGTWSAVAVARREQGRDPIADLAAELAAAWPDEPGETGRRAVSWPIGLRVGRLGTGGPGVV